MNAILTTRAGRCLSFIIGSGAVLLLVLFFSDASARPRLAENAGAASRLSPERVATYTPAVVDFSTPMRLVRPPIPPTPGVTLLDQDQEPEIKNDIFGNIYITAIDGVPGGVDLWKSLDRGATFTYLGHPDGAQDQCGNPPLPTCVGGAGGGDDSIDVSSGGYLYVSSLSLASVTVSTSMDGGAGGALPGQAWVVNPATSGIPVEDRQWLVAYGPQTVYMTFRQAPGTGRLLFVKSTDAGKTWSAPTLLTSANSTQGNLVVDQYNGYLYTSFIPASAPNRIDMLKSTDGGTTWGTSTVYTGPAGTNPGHKFTIMAVDRGGNVHLAFSRSASDGTNNHVWLTSSTDFGANWLAPVQVDSGSNNNTAVMPWIVGGSPGVVDVTWIGSSGPSASTAPFDWEVFFAQVTNATSASPAIAQKQVTTEPMHDKVVCFNGTGCASGTRDLTEYYTMTTDPEGNAQIAYMDSVHQCVTSNCVTTVWFTKQTSGSSALNPPPGPAPATFSANLAVGSPGAEPSLWVDSYNCVYVTAPGTPWVWKSINNGASFFPPVNPVADEPTLTGGDEDIITIPKPDGTRPDEVYFTDLGLSSDHIRKSTDGGANWFKPGPGGAAGDTGISSDRQWLAVDRIGTDKYVYEVDHELASEIIRLSTLPNDTSWVTQNALVDPELSMTVPNTNPGPIFINKSTHQIIGVFNASIPQTNAMNPPFGKLLNLWEFVAEPPATAGGVPVSYANYPVHKGVLDSPSTAPAGALTYGTNNAQIFPAGDVDTAGNIYVAWSMNNSRTNEFSIWFASSHDGGKTFYGPFPISSGSLAPDETAVLPWLAAGDNGRVDVVYYKTSTVGDPNTLPTGASAAVWRTYFAQSLNANSREPVFTTVEASDHIIHRGRISTGGLLGSSDRSLLDYFEVNIGPDGLANIIFADNGSSATHAEFTKQNGGPLAFTNPVIRTCLAPSIVPLSAVSRKTHGNAGTFDVPMPLTGPSGVEPRGSANGAYQLVVIFPNAVTVASASVTGTGQAASATSDGAIVTVNLTGVTSPQKIIVNLNGVNDGTNPPGTVSIPMGICLGDVNDDRTTNAADATLVRNLSGQTTTGANFRSDVNADGVVNSADATIVRARSGDQVPP